MSALVSARDWRLRSMAICVSSLEDRTCSTAARVFKRTSEVRAVIQCTCERVLFVSSLATCYPQFIFASVGSLAFVDNSPSAGLFIWMRESRSSSRIARAWKPQPTHVSSAREH